MPGPQRLKRLTGAPILFNPNDLPLVKIMDIQAGWLGVRIPSRPPDTPLYRGADDLHLWNLGFDPSSPGHTQGSVCLYVPEHSSLSPEILSSPVPWDEPTCPEATAANSIASIRSKLLALPDETIVIPGHGANLLSIGERRENNPFITS